MGPYEQQLVPVKLPRLAEYISQQKHISLDQALVYIYTNPMYPRLYDENAKWWYLSNEALFDEFESAKHSAPSNPSPQAFEFYAYTLEHYALAKALTGLQAYALLKRYGADQFLLDHYDLLHTQGTAYVIDEIDLYIKNRKKK